MSSWRLGWVPTFAIALALLVSFLLGPARADEVADFYRGRTLQVIVGYGPGGGNDVYARVLARHMGRHLPGAPNIVVQNMPGAGSLVAANYIANLAPKDGTAFGTFARNLPLSSVIGGHANIRFDARKLTWLGSASSYAGDAYILWVRLDSSVQSIDDAWQQARRPLMLSGTAEGDTSYDVAVLLRDVLKLNIKLIGGYPDSNALFLAAENKEVDGRVADLSSVMSSRPQWRTGMRQLLQFGRATRHPDFPSVPTARELAPAPADAALIEIMEAPFVLSRPYAGPSGIPPARAKALQAAFMAMQKDPAYVEEATRLQLDLSPIGPTEVQALLDRVAGSPPELLARVRTLLGGKP
jgi:tripartite-type tricarboxylate transporter receptor subunit TctC